VSAQPPRLVSPPGQGAGRGTPGGKATDELREAVDIPESHCCFFHWCTKETHIYEAANSIGRRGRCSDTAIDTPRQKTWNTSGSLPILPSSEGGSVERVGRTYGGYGRPLRTSEGQASKRFKGIRGSRGSGSGLGCLGSFACHQVSKYEVSRLPLACAVRLPHGHFMFMYIAVLLSCSSCFTTLLLVHAAKEQRRQTADGTSRPDPRPT
jgi:hypothetical protein